MIFAYIAIIPALIASVHAAVIPVTLNGQNLSELRKRAGEDRQWDGGSPQEGEDSPTNQSRPTPPLRLRSGDKQKIDKIDARIAKNDQRVKTKQEQKDQERHEQYNWELMLANAETRMELKVKSAKESSDLELKSKTESINRKREREEKKKNPRQRILNKLDKEQESLIEIMATALEKVISKLNSDLVKTRNKIKEKRNKMKLKWDLQDMKKDAKEKYRASELERRRELALEIAEVRAKDKENGINGSIFDRMRRMVAGMKARARKGKTDGS
ncbi:hypothetical protein BASA50_007254 [Batrachochytrium salamandrivorans]|uniref:Uncharacterized protein n=1 Tax=Batrachochytrium salamandrivorans TaxID=1357716 RepID=A0ABQ8F846_9FUNG|nr:hypothetical protein BASA50_007254 [Batrachochytrium salamandrivorans]KAJ1330015.1 hypothetical protein BSLG_009803 [Batrachochytrium salamandrivorans]